MGEKNSKEERWTPTKDELREILELHENHIEEAVLFGAHLEGTDLSGAHLEGAKLMEVHLERAYLHKAHLEGAYLRGAHLEGACLSEAHLEGADLSSANLKEAILFEVHFEGACLRGANLEGAVLSGAHLEGADLSGANLEGAVLSNAILNGTQKRIKSWDPKSKLITEQLEILSPSKLNKCNLAGAVLENADLSGVDLSTCTFDWRYDINTQTNLCLRETRLIDSNLRDQNFHAGFQPRWANKNWLSKILFGWWLKHLFHGSPIYFDDTLIERARMSRNINEPWHILKRNYTGFVLFLILMAVGASLIPLAIEALFWKNYQSVIDAYANSSVEVDRVLPEAIQDKIPDQQEVKNFYNNPEKVRKVPIVSHILGLHKFTLSTYLTVILIGYTLIRSLVTYKTNQLYQNELSTSYTPKKKEYQFLFLTHWYLMRPATVVAFIALCFTLFELLFTQVKIPQIDSPSVVQIFRQLIGG